MDATKAPLVYLCFPNIHYSKACTLKKVLIIRLSSLGDIILTTPVIRCIKNQTHADIHYVTRRQNAFLVKQNPYISKVIEVDKDPLEQFGFFKSEGYDFVIDLHNNFRSRRFTLYLNRPTGRFPKLNIKKWLLVNCRLNLMPDLHIVDRYFRAASKLRIVNDREGLEYFIPKEPEEQAREIAAGFPDGYTVIVAGAKHFTKQIPAEIAKKIVKEADGPFIVLGGPEDARRGDEIEAAAPEKVSNYCGKISFDVSAAIVSKAQSVITSDTGLMHVAAAFKRPTLVLWGNTVPEFGMYPYMPGNRHLYYPVENRSLSCRPCSKIGFDACPKKHFRCMLDTDVVQIARILNTIKKG